MPIDTKTVFNCYVVNNSLWSLVDSAQFGEEPKQASILQLLA